MSSSSTTPKKKRGRPKGSKNKRSTKRQKEIEAAVVNDDFENAFEHVPVANIDEPAMDESLDFGLNITPPGFDNDNSSEDDVAAEQEDDVGFGSADMYDVAELLELTKMDVNDNLKKDGETTDDIIKELRNGCVNGNSKKLYESANILFLLHIFKRQKILCKTHGSGL